MAPKSYGQPCPMASALDQIGSRWTMLILRDLMAGPARYVDLQRGIPGLASNLLTERLRALEELELIAKVDGPYNVTLYQLTERGELARGALAELGKLGLALGIVDPRRPRAEGSLRFLALPLQALVEEGLPTPTAIAVALQVDDEWFAVAVTAPQQPGDQRATVRHMRPSAPGAVLEVGYDVVADVLIGGGEPRRLLDDALGTRGDERQLEALVSTLERAVAALRRR